MRPWRWIVARIRRTLTSAPVRTRPLVLPDADEAAGRWRLFTVQAGDRVIEHAVPVADEQHHRLGLDCPCRPSVIVNTPAAMFISHSSWDAREDWERHYP